MHLHALEGAWMDHPFWKTRFIIRDADQLKKLTDSVIKEVWIDPEKGLDVVEDGPASLPAPARTAAPAPAPVAAARAIPAQPAAAPARPASTPVPAPSRSFAEEMRTATAV